MQEQELREQVRRILAAIRESTPLVQAITNYVTVNDAANMLLAAGASPVMCENPVEMEQFVPLAGALVLNLGTLTEEQKKAMEIAVRVAAGHDIPVVLDPVGYGAIAEKARVTAALAAAGRFAAIKGNQGEIMNLSGRAGRMRGVDSLSGEDEIADACRDSARRYRFVVVASGERDYLSDGEHVLRLANGDALLARVSGTGCMVGMLVGAALAVAPAEPLVAAAAALTLFNVAGEAAAKSDTVRGPASYKIALLDAVAGTSPEAAAAGMRATWL